MRPVRSRMSTHTHGLALIVAALLAAATAPAREPPAPPAAPAPAPFIATRADLARAYLRFETAYAATPPPIGPLRSRLHARFDGAAAYFFRGDLSGAVAHLDALTLELDAHAPPFTLPSRGPLTGPAHALRAALAARLNALAHDPDLAPARAAARSRLSLITDDPDQAHLIQLLTNPARAAAELAAEVGALEAGTDPYRRRTGDWWLTIRTADGIELPARLYAPDAASFERRPPLPLVIALHGAGGDENMFMDAYGRGRIKALADQHGFIVASVGTVQLGGQPGALDALLAQCRAHYGIDERRVYVVGHSLGAGAAALLATTRRDVVAAAACIAGGTQRIPAGACAPILVFAAEHDGIIPARRLRAVAESAAATGLPIEYREAQGAGHVLIVNDVLPDAVAWLLTRQRPDPPAPPAALPAPTVRPEAASGR